MSIFDRSKYFFLHSAWSRAFIVTLFFVTLASGLFWLDFFRGYRAEVTLLVVPKAGGTADISSAPENLSELARTLSFYERVVAGTDLIDDAFEGYAPDKRKALWNDAVSVKHSGGSGILVVEARGDTPQIAARLARQTAQTLLAVAGFYYNVKTDIDMRIIDGPIVAYVLVRPVIFVLTSLLSGVGVTSLFFVLLSAVPGWVGGRARMELPGEKGAVSEKTSREFALGESIPWIDPRKFIPAKPVTLSFEHSPEIAKESVPSRLSQSAAPHAPAPANLPIADEGAAKAADEAALPFSFEAMPEEVEESLVESESEPEAAPIFPVRGEHAIRSAEQPPRAGSETGEPTAEAYKRRLNELLSGSR